MFLFCSPILKNCCSGYGGSGFDFSVPRSCRPSKCGENKKHQWPHCSILHTQIDKRTLAINAQTLRCTIQAVGVLYTRRPGYEHVAATRDNKNTRAYHLNRMTNVWQRPQALMWTFYVHNKEVAQKHSSGNESTVLKNETMCVQCEPGDTTQLIF